MAECEPAISVETVGANPVRFWGLDTAERVRRIAVRAGLGGTGAPVLLADAGHVFDPAWLAHVAARPGSVLTLDDRPVLAHARSELEAAEVRDAMRGGAPLPSGMSSMACEALPDERPFLMELTAETRGAAERASYLGARTDVTDALTRYLWSRLSLTPTRLAARLGLSPNAITLIGALFCIAAAIAFAHGAYWEGMVLALVFTVLDTVDGQLARCTVATGRWGAALDRGIELVHPPFWWWFWATGLAHLGLGLSDTLFWWVVATVFAGHVLQRAIERVFEWQFGISIHAWRRFDSGFRLVTAGRNPNMAILFLSLLAGRPDVGIVAVAVWTAVSLTVHLIRLGQALQRRARGQAIASWLADK